MIRREFFRSVFGFLGLGWLAGTVGVSRPAPQPAYYFDWGVRPDAPYTDDPAWAGRLTYGYHNHTTCDGVEVLYARRFVTGPDGWVEYAKRDAVGSFGIVRGHVRFYTAPRDRLPEMSNA